MRIINVPIEPLEERYSIQWNEWFEKYFISQSIPFVTIKGETLSDKITKGSFLDIAGTHHYKFTQLQTISKMFFNNEIDNNDVFLFHDIWFPGFEGIAYMRDALGIDVKITGCIHAGTYDITDMLSRWNMNYWGKPLEESWFRIVDKIFVGSEYHRRMLITNRDIDPKKIVVTGFPIYYDPSPLVQKEKIIVFPHRLDSDKHPELFDWLITNKKETLYPDWQFIKTKDLPLSKQEYYELLNKSRMAVSFAEHENFGIAMQEALFFNCIPLVSNKLSYPELFDPIFQYGSFDEFLSKLEDYTTLLEVDSWKEYIISALNKNKQKLLERGKQAIPNMIEEIKKLC